jgi:hypothetical protein
VQRSRVTRTCARLAIALAAVSWAASAQADTVPGIDSVAVPALAVSQGHVVVAWTAGGIVQAATQNPDGSFPRGVAVGRAVGGAGPALAVTPRGDQMLVWRSGDDLRSAFRRAGGGAWKQETVSSRAHAQSISFVMTRSGLAVAAWAAYPSDSSGKPLPDAKQSLFVSTHPDGGVWSRPVVLAENDVLSVSLATDGAGDVVAAYKAGDAVWAAVLPGGASEWSAPVVASGTDNPAFFEFGLTGGPGRDFFALWQAPNPAQQPNAEPIPSVTRTSRLRLPGAWAPPRDLVPATNDEPARYAMGSSYTIALDPFGNATATWQFPLHDWRTAEQDNVDPIGLGVSRLPATADGWAPPATLDLPPRPKWADSRPSIAVAADGSATLAFIQGFRNDFHLVVTTAQGPFGPWQGQATTAASLPKRTPCKTVVCAKEWKVRPVLALAGAGRATIAAQSTKQVVVAFARAVPGGPWRGPMTLRPAGRTTVFLPGRRVRDGVVPFLATCTLPPCVGVVELRDDKTDERLGRAAFTFRTAGRTPGRFLLPASARDRLARGEQLRVKLSYDVLEGDGTKEHLFLITHLHLWRR